MTARLARIAAFLLILGGCTSGTGTSGGTVADRESQSANALKKQYAGVIMGNDVKGSTLMLYIDVNGMDQMDEDAEIAMKKHALAFWKNAWSKDHPHRHDAVTVILRDFTGKEVYREKASV